jgi:hypothetical protein
MLALTAPTNGGRSVCMVRSRTQTTEFSFFVDCTCFLNYQVTYMRMWLANGSTILDKQTQSSDIRMTMFSISYPRTIEPQRCIYDIYFSPVLNVRSRCKKTETNAKGSLNVDIALISLIISGVRNLIRIAHWHCVQYPNIRTSDIMYH